MKHVPRKRFGQHFLTDGGIIDAIVSAIAPRAGQLMVEIGPGLSALTQPLVERLGHNVLKTGLRKISISYSRISLADIAAKLHLPSATAAEYICAKAIRYDAA